MTESASMAEVVARLTRLEDIKAIEELKYTYAGFCDAGYNPEGIANLFVEDGRWVVDGEGATLTGREEIKAHFAALSERITWALHYMIAPNIQIDPFGDRATGTFYLLCLCTIERTDDANEKDAVILTINYRDTFVKRDGKWYFEELIGLTHQVSDWEQGWVKQPFRP